MVQRLFGPTYPKWRRCWPMKWLAPKVRWPERNPVNSIKFCHLWMPQLLPNAWVRPLSFPFYHALHCGPTLNSDFFNSEHHGDIQAAFREVLLSSADDTSPAIIRSPRTPRTGSSSTIKTRDNTHSRWYGCGYVVLRPSWNKDSSDQCLWNEGVANLWNGWHPRCVDPTDPLSSYPS